MAHQFEAPFVRVFAFRREPEAKGNYEAAVTLFKEFAVKAVAAGVNLAVENEGGYWGALPAEMDQFLRDVGSPRAWNLLDPGNHLNQNQCLLEEKDVALLAPRTRYIHVKDARRGRRGYVVVGTGDIPYVSIFRQLREAGVIPVICLETHLGGLFRGRTSARCLTNLINSIRASGYDFG
jgi:sugar phosphate isomerase/epimerase